MDPIVFVCRTIELLTSGYSKDPFNKNVYAN